MSNAASAFGAPRILSADRLIRSGGRLQDHAQRHGAVHLASDAAAVSIFFAQVVLNHGIPFAVQLDPFYSRSNMDELAQRAADMDAGVNCSEHELIVPKAVRRAF